MALKFTMYTSGLEALKAAFVRGCSKAGRAVAKQAAIDTEPLVPMDTKSLRNRTLVIGDTIIYPGPYARYLYYGKYMVNAATGKGPAHYVDAKEDEHIKYPKGAKLVPTERNLTFHTPGTRARWFEVSKARNIAKWERVAKEAIRREY